MAKSKKVIRADGVVVHCAHSRIVPVGDLKPNPLNPNCHPEQQIKILVYAINGHGWRVPITVSNRSGLVVRGHGRLLAAIEGGWSHVPVDYQDYDSDDLELADLAADNVIPELAFIDQKKMADIIGGMDTNFNFELLGYDQAALDEIIAGGGVGTGEDGDSPLGKSNLFDRFIVPPFSVLDARQGYWQERKRAWLAIGIQSELGRGEDLAGSDGAIDRCEDIKKGKPLTWGISSAGVDTGGSGKAYTKRGKRKARTFGQDLMKGEHVVGTRKKN